VRGLEATARNPHHWRVSFDPVPASQCGRGLDGRRLVAGGLDRLAAL